MTFGDPGDRMDITQTSRAFLDVGFEIVGGIVELTMARGLLAELGLEKGREGPDRGRSGRGAHGLIKADVTGKQACFHEIRHDGDIVGRQVPTLRHRTDAVPDLEANIPEEAQKRFDAFMVLGCNPGPRQHQDIDVRTRMQLAASVTSGSDQSKRFARELPLPPGARDQLVHEPGALGDQLGDRRAHRETLPYGSRSGRQSDLIDRERRGRAF